MSTTRKIAAPANTTTATLKDLWTAACAGLAAYRDRKAAAAIYTELSRLSDAELARRGISRADLHAMVSELDKG